MVWLPRDMYREAAKFVICNFEKVIVGYAIYCFCPSANGETSKGPSLSTLLPRCCQMAAEAGSTSSTIPARKA